MSQNLPGIYPYPPTSKPYALRTNPQTLSPRPNMAQKLPEIPNAP